MKSNLPDILWINKEGFFDFRHIDGYSYTRTRESFAKDGIKLPTWDKLKSFGKRSDLRLMLSDLVISIRFVDGANYRYTFKRGYITDLASVPSYFRSFIDNDDIDMLAAALCHDYNFSTHVLSFNKTNDLFYQMFLARQGIPGSADKWLSLPRRARLAWAAVSSPVGRLLWAKNKKRRYAWTTNTSEFQRMEYGRQG